MATGFVFAADLHLQRHAWADRPDLWGDAYYSLRQIVTYCIEHGLPLVLGGDVIDVQHPDSEVIAVLFNEMQRMAVVRLNVYYIQGQHEMREVPWLSCHPWPIHVHNTTFNPDTSLELRLYGMDWQPGHELESALQWVPAGTNVLIAHQAWTDLMGHNGDGTLEMIPGHVPTVMTGDYHVHLDTELTFADGRISHHAPLRVISPGSTCMQSITEAPEKYFCHCTVRGDGSLFVLPVALKTRSVYRYELQEEYHVDDMINDHLPGVLAHCRDGRSDDRPLELAQPILVVDYNEDLHDVPARVFATVDEDMHTWLRPQRAANVEQMDLMQDDVEVIRGGLLGGLLEVQDQLDGRVYEAARRLLEVQPNQVGATLDALENDMNIDQEVLQNLVPEHANQQTDNAELLPAPVEDSDVSTGAERYPRRQRRR